MGIPIQGSWVQSGTPMSGTSLQGGTVVPLQGSPASQAQNTGATGQGSVLGVATANPFNYRDPSQNSVVGSISGIDPNLLNGVSGIGAGGTGSTTSGPSASSLRNQVMALVNQIKDIYNSRYGQVDASAGEQAKNLTDRFTNESGDLTKQIGDQNEQVGAGYAGNGTYDSSYRGNSQDQVTQAGQGQIRDLGTELQGNLNKVAGWDSTTKAGFDAQKSGLDTVLGHLAESNDPAELQSIRNTLDSRIADLNSQSADNNTSDQNSTALNAIAPVGQRSVQLQTTLGHVLGSNADPSAKSAIAQRLIAGADLPAADTNKILTDFYTQLHQPDQTQQQ